MDATAVDYLLSVNPTMKDIKGIRQFFTSGLHWKMERNDTKNNTKWFDNMKEKGWKPCMDAHREGCRGVFDFDNYDDWCNRDIISQYNFVDDSDDENLAEDDWETPSYIDIEVSDEELEFVSVNINGIKYYRQVKNGNPCDEKFYEILDNHDVGDEVELCCNPDCGLPYGKYGNNPKPLWNEGKCCNNCNELVVMDRMGMMKFTDGLGKEMTIPKKSIEELAERQGISVEELIECMKGSDCLYM